MAFLTEISSGAIAQVTLGATQADGGSRSHTLTIGGECSLPFQSYEGNCPHRAIIAAEVTDYAPEGWAAALREAWGECLSSPASWAAEAVSRGADMIFLRLMGMSPDYGFKSVEDCVAVVRSVLESVGCPIAIQGCDDIELDRPLITAIAEEFKGENLLLGLAKQENYATYSAACIANGHSVIASSPLDINMCKQLNILISDMNMPLERIVIDPSIGGLGYGLEYAYSILERGRIGALQGDRMLALPVIGFVGAEAWKAKEANADEVEFPKWGDREMRGVSWEIITATSLLQSGLHILVMRHPEAMKVVKGHIDELMKPIVA